MTEIKLGNKARDTVTGFEGIVTSITDWLNGCTRLGLQPPKAKDGTVPPVEVFDVEQLEFVGHGVTPAPTRRPREQPARLHGGTRPNVARGQDTPR